MAFNSLLTYALYISVHIYNLSALIDKKHLAPTVRYSDLF